MKKSRDFVKRIVALAAVSSIALTNISVKAFSYGEFTVDNDAFRNQSDNSEEYKNWISSCWNDGEKQFSDSGKVALTPGKSEKDLNFAWYSKEKGTPAVKVWTEGNEAAAKIFTGNATDIDAENWQGSQYKATNKVSIQDFFNDNTNYKYQYTDNYSENNTVWSESFDYKKGSSDSFSLILTGDPQIGASDSKTDTDINDLSVSRDTYNWNKTMNQAIKTCPDASFLLSAGDQVDTSGATSSDNKKTRESEYAGYLYPSVFRNLPIASTIGNHDTAGSDYSMHFNNPNSSLNEGATNAGCDYYFSYGNVLFISLNSNNRNQEEHRALLKQAVESNKDAKWKVVIFHSDIYGSGEPHADTDASTNRIVLAPLMDEFNIDICLTGHDHTYSRSKFIYDGNVIDYDYSKNSVTNPEGTMYITTGSGSGSKYYNLLNYTPYYIAERTNKCLPSFSTMDFTDSSMTIKTYDYDGNKYADDYTINKTDKDISVSEVIDKAENTLKDTNVYTDDSVNALKSALNNLKAYQAGNKTPEDNMISELTSKYNTADDRAKGYGSITSDDDKDVLADNKLANRFKEGLSSLLDKTIYSQLNAGVEVQNPTLPIEKAEDVENLKTAVLNAIDGLKLKESNSTENGDPENNNSLNTDDKTQNNNQTAATDNNTDNNEAQATTGTQLSSNPKGTSDTSHMLGYLTIMGSIVGALLAGKKKFFTK